MGPKFTINLLLTLAPEPCFAEKARRFMCMCVIFVLCQALLFFPSFLRKVYRQIPFILKMERRGCKENKIFNFFQSFHTTLLATAKAGPKCVGKENIFSLSHLCVKFPSKWMNGYLKVSPIVSNGTSSWQLKYVYYKLHICSHLLHFDCQLTFLQNCVLLGSNSTGILGAGLLKQLIFYWTQTWSWIEMDLKNQCHPETSGAARPLHSVH